MKRAHRKTAAGTVASLLTATSAHAIVQVVTGSPLSVSASGSSGFDVLPWDIDGNAVTDANLFANAFTHRVTSSSSSSTVILPTDKGLAGVFGVGTSSSSGGHLANFANNGLQLKPIPGNANVGSNYSFGVNGGFFQISSGAVSAIGFAAIPNNSGIIGFSFLRDNALHYGVANVSWDASGVNSVSLTINSWAWNDEAGAPVPASAVASVPEPATVALGLAGLALGAAGLRRRRNAKH